MIKIVCIQRSATPAHNGRMFMYVAD